MLTSRSLNVARLRGDRFYCWGTFVHAALIKIPRVWIRDFCCFGQSRSTKTQCLHLLGRNIYPLDFTRRDVIEDSTQEHYRSDERKISQKPPTLLGNVLLIWKCGSRTSAFVSLLIFATSRDYHIYPRYYWLWRIEFICRKGRSAKNICNTYGSLCVRTAFIEMRREKVSIRRSWSFYTAFSFGD